MFSELDFLMISSFNHVLFSLFFWFAHALSSFPFIADGSNSQLEVTCVGGQQPLYATIRLVALLFAPALQLPSSRADQSPDHALTAGERVLSRALERCSSPGG